MSRTTHLGGEPNPHPGPLFATARATDPQTSHDAAAAVDAETLCGLVYACLKRAGPAGLTNLEVSKRIAAPGVDPVAALQSISPRFSNLRRLGLAEVRKTIEGTPIRRDGRQVWAAR